MNRNDGDEIQKTDTEPPVKQPARNPVHSTYVIDSADWLKTNAIMLVAIGHFSYFFIYDAGWWSVYSRMGAPVFLFLLGYARSRTIPLRWIWLGVILTLLDSWNNYWTWVAPNILLSLALIRLVRPYVKELIERYEWVGFIVIITTLVALAPFAGDYVDYGAEGWLWALFGLCQRIYVDSRFTLKVDDTAVDTSRPLSAKKWTMNAMRLLACLTAATVYVWQEQIEFEFNQSQSIVLMLCASVLSLYLFHFVRGPSRFQPPKIFAGIVHFIGRHTLEIYVIQLAGSELIIKFFPGLAT
jgi:hypothetical protein